MSHKQSLLALNDVRGFTLIELVVVIVILGILAATALPKFINLNSDANAAVVNNAKGAIKSAVSLFKAKTLASGTGFTTEVEYSNVKGSHHQPWAATALSTGFSANYSSPPEIYEAAGLNVDDWAYRIYVDSGSYAVVGAPRTILNVAQPTEAEVKATNCYLNYHWKTTGEPIVTTVITGC